MSGDAIWKHIGLHGHSVGTFALDDSGIKWKSALYGQDEGGSSTRSVPKDSILAAYWTVFGKSGHMRIKTTGEKTNHELRFDGFKTSEFDTLRTSFKDNLDVDLVKYNMSSAGTQYGISKLAGGKLTYRHCLLDDAEEEGEVSFVLFEDLCSGMKEGMKEGMNESLLSLTHFSYHTGIQKN
jgi:hypothetical protein